MDDGRDTTGSAHAQWSLGKELFVEEPVRALPHLQAAFKLDPLDKHRRKLAVCEKRVGSLIAEEDMPAAVAHLRAAHELLPGHPPIGKRLAKLEFRLGKQLLGEDPVAALPHLQAAFELDAVENHRRKLAQCKKRVGSSSRTQTIDSSIARPGKPNPSAPAKIDKTVLLLLTPPYSGSTAMAAYVCQSERVKGLHKKYEGQWASESMSAKGRWNPNASIDMDQVKSALGAIVDELSGRNDRFEYVFEKSPPNMVRYLNVIDLFERSRVVVSNRNPYAQVSSMYHRSQFHREAQPSGTALPKEREARIVTWAEHWIERSAVLRHIVESEKFPLSTYEEFCERPDSLVSAFGLAAFASEYAPQYAVGVKDYPAQTIRNMNAVQIERLSARELDLIAETLESHTSLLEFFGYEVGVERS